LDYESSEVHKRAAIIVFSPGDANDQGLFRRHQFRVARLGIPFIHDVGAEPFLVEELAKYRHSILVYAVPVLPEIITLQELL